MPDTGSEVPGSRSGTAFSDPEPSGTDLRGVFGSEQITATRHAVVAHAAAAGLRGTRLEDFALAVNEMMTNAVRHGGGGGTLCQWVDGLVLTCDITDDGPGIPAECRSGRLPPPVFVAHGRGLWITRKVCDAVVIVTSESGTTVRLSMALGADGTRPVDRTR